MGTPDDTRTDRDDIWVMASGRPREACIIIRWDAH